MHKMIYFIHKPIYEHISRQNRLSTIKQKVSEQESEVLISTRLAFRHCETTATACCVCDNNNTIEWTIVFFNHSAKLCRSSSAGEVARFTGVV